MFFFHTINTKVEVRVPTCVHYVLAAPWYVQNIKFMRLESGWVWFSFSEAVWLIWFYVNLYHVTNTDWYLYSLIYVTLTL